MNIAAAVSLIATATGFVFGVIWWRISKAPGWHAMRWFAGVAVTAAGYCAFDSLVVFELPHWVILAATHMAFTTASLHAYCWIRWLADSVPRPLDRLDKAVLASAVAWAVAGFVPGLLVGSKFGEYHVDLINVTYRAFVPTPLGLVGYLFFLLTMWVVAGRSIMRWQHGWRARMPAIAVSILTILAVNDALATAQVIKTPMLVDFGFLIVILLFGVDSLRQFASQAERLEALTHRLEQAVAERTRQLEVAHLELAKERTVAAVGRLAGGVAHQINNPATVISMNLGHMRDELVERGQLNPAMGELLDESRESLHRILGIVTDLRTSAGAIETRSETRHSSSVRVCVDAAVERAVHRVGRVARTETSVAPDLQAIGDRDLITQMLTELVANAAEAAGTARAASAQVRVEARAYNGYVQVDVTDNGDGVPPAVRAALFEPFAGAQGVAQRRGLGLSVVRGLAEQIGASLSLVESSSHGTTFRVSLQALTAS